MNLTEVYVGMRDIEKVKTEQFLSSLEFFPIGPDVARLARVLRREWKPLGLNLSYTGVNIAAVAIHHRIALLTDNARQFPMPELELYPLPD